MKKLGDGAMKHLDSGRVERYKKVLVCPEESLVPLESIQHLFPGLTKFSSRIMVKDVLKSGIVRLYHSNGTPVYFPAWAYMSKQREVIGVGNVTTVGSLSGEEDGILDRITINQLNAVCSMAMAMRNCAIENSWKRSSEFHRITATLYSNLALKCLLKTTNISTESENFFSYLRYAFGAYMLYCLTDRTDDVILSSAKHAASRGGKIDIQINDTNHAGKLIEAVNGDFKEYINRVGEIVNIFKNQTGSNPNNTVRLFQAFFIGWTSLYGEISTLAFDNFPMFAAMMVATDCKYDNYRLNAILDQKENADLINMFCNYVLGPVVINK